MNKESCSIPQKNDGQGYIVNCAGERVAITDTGFTSRCAIGNTDDYLKKFNNYINSEIVSIGKPASISIVVPSYSSDEEALSKTLISLCSQEYSVSTELLVFINEPEKPSEKIRIINGHNERFLRFFENIKSAHISPELTKTQKLLLAAISKSRGNITLKCVRQAISGGLPGAYQVITASFIARVRAFCDNLTSGCDRQEKIKTISGYLNNTMLLFCDDDMEIKDSQTISKAYDYAVNNDAVVLGRLNIESVNTSGKNKSVLRDLMQLFFDFKYDRGLNFLTPRGILLKNILKAGGVKIGEPFADQMFFASAARGNKQYLLEAITSISESDYPGNGIFLKKIRLYLEGENNNALNIFENVLKRYQEDKHNGKYQAAHIEKLIQVLKTRDIGRISDLVSELLAIA